MPCALLPLLGSPLVLHRAAIRAAARARRLAPANCSATARIICRTLPYKHAYGTRSAMLRHLAGSCLLRHRTRLVPALNDLLAFLCVASTSLLHRNYLWPRCTTTVVARTHAEPFRFSTPRPPACTFANYDWTYFAILRRARLLTTRVTPSRGCNYSTSSIYHYHEPSYSAFSPSVTTTARRPSTAIPPYHLAVATACNLRDNRRARTFSFGHILCSASPFSPAHHGCVDGYAMTNYQYSRT